MGYKKDAETPQIYPWLSSNKKKHEEDNCGNNDNEKDETDKTRRMGRRNMLLMMMMRKIRKMRAGRMRIGLSSIILGASKNTDDDMRRKIWLSLDVSKSRHFWT